MIEATTSESRSWISSALTAFGGFATAAFSFIALRIADAKKDERLYQREKLSKDESRRDKIIETRNERERSNLINLQAALQKLARCRGRMHHHDILEAYNGSGGPGFHYPKDISLEALEANQAVTALSALIHSEDVRTYVAIFREADAEFIICKDVSEADKLMATFSRTYKLLNEAIGEAWRRLDKVELAD